VSELSVFSLGDNCLDVYLSPVDCVFVGGSALNVAVGLARRGVPASYMGAVGSDRGGDAVLSALASHNVDASHVCQVEGEATAVTEIALEEGAERRFLQEHYAIHSAYDPSEEEWELLGRARHVHATRVPRHLGRLLSLGRGRTHLSYDFSVDPLPARLDGLDIAFIPHDRLPPDIDLLESAKQLVERGCGCAVVTRGAEGSLAATSAESTSEAALPVASVVDTCGAGDAFMAAFIAAHLVGAALSACLERGAQAGAEACSMIGAFPQDSLPTLALQ
jgi:fructoselysine 6-kinase